MRRVEILAFIYKECDIQKVYERWEENNRRRQLLAAYRRRRNWKRSDETNLLSLNPGPHARKRIKGLKRTGRPIVRRYLSISEVFRILNRCFDANSSPLEQEKAFKGTAWWPHYVEALYRGEHRKARNAQIRGPSDHAEHAVANALSLSASKVHQLCVQIRKLRKEAEGNANFLSITLDQRKVWFKTGEHPWCINE